MLFVLAVSYQNCSEPMQAASTAPSILLDEGYTPLSVEPTPIDPVPVEPPVGIEPPITEPSNDSCNLVKGVGAGVDPLFQPNGFIPHVVSWTDIYHYSGSPNTVWDYPNSPGFYPVGSWTMGNIGLSVNTSMKGRYISIPFVANTQDDPLLTIEWWQPVPLSHFRLYKSLGRGTEVAWMTISPCSGDFRQPNKSGNGPADGGDLWSACRKNGNIGKIYYGNNSCKLINGRTYYINLIFADPAGGLSPNETSCGSDTGICDVLFYN